MTSTQLIVDINHLKVNQEYMFENQFTNAPVKHRCLGNYGGGNKVYMTKATSTETPESMSEKFKANKLPDCFVVWDAMLGTSCKIRDVEKEITAYPIESFTIEG